MTTMTSAMLAASVAPTTVAAQSAQPFVAAEFKVPERLETPEFRLRMLTVHDALVYFWVRQSELGKGLDARLSSAVRDWIAQDWPFENAAYPGRDIEWEAWRAIPDEKR